jgi:hypothetical protein
VLRCAHTDARTSALLTFLAKLATSTSPPRFAPLLLMTIYFYICGVCEEKGDPHALVGAREFFFVISVFLCAAFYV